MEKLKSKKEILDYLRENGASESNLCEVCETDRCYFFIYSDIDSSFILENRAGVCIIKSKDGYFSIDVDCIEDSMEYLDIDSVEDLTDEDLTYYQSKIEDCLYRFKSMLKMTNNELDGVDRLHAELGDNVISYKDVSIYYTFKDNDDDNNSPSDYWFTLDVGNVDEEFDIRELACYDDKLDEVEILKKAIDLGIIK